MHIFILTLPFALLAVFILAVISFFFSISETSIIALSKIKLQHLAAKGVKGAQSVKGLVTNLDKFIAAILIGNNIVNVAMSAIITAVFVSILGYDIGVIAATLATSCFIVLFCEITPKLLAIKHTEKIALLSAPIMTAVIKLLDPFVRMFLGVSRLIMKIFGSTAVKRSPLITEEELRLMIEVGKEEGVLTDEERKMLHRIFEFGETKVADVMVSFKDVIAVDVKSTQDELLDILAEEGHARVPVFKDARENVTGIIYVRDLLYLLKEKQLFLLEDLTHPPYFVPAQKSVNELLREFQSKKIQIAVVIDEKQKAIGLVTLEDLVEEIVGEIEESVSHENHSKVKR
ncbi:MAG: hemolysin family protein [Candidatus Omnitrophota bacterium]